MNAAGSNPVIVAARCDRQSAVSKRVMADTPQRPNRMASTNAAVPSPNGEMLLRPVTTTRSHMRPVRYHVVLRRSTASVASSLLLPVAALALTAPAVASADLFDQIFAQTLARRQSIQSIRARFTETTTSTLLQKPLVAHGTVIAAPPSRVLMTYTDPERKLVAIDGSSLIVAWPDRHERETIDIAQTQKRIDKYFKEATIGELRSMFDIHAEADNTLGKTDRVVMRPKRKQIREGLELLELWIDRDTLLLAQLQMTLQGGDVKTIRLEDMALNVPIAPETFQIRPESGTKR